MYYELYIDVLFLVNFMMDYILLLIARRILKCRTAYRNICLGALAGALLTCIVVALPIPYASVKFILFHTVVNITMIKIGLRIGWNRTLAKALITLYISGFLVGGVFEYLDQYVKTGSLFFALAILSYYIASGVLSLLSSFFHFWEYRCHVVLYLGEKNCEVEAILDTGNHLTDHVTGKAVSVIGKQTAQRLLDGKMPERLRYIPYQSIGRQDGVIPVITVDRLCVKGKEEQWVEKPLIGISETDISAGKEYDMILNPDIE